MTLRHKPFAKIVLHILPANTPRSASSSSSSYSHVIDRAVVHRCEVLAAYQNPLFRSGGLT